MTVPMEGPTDRLMATLNEYLDYLGSGRGDQMCRQSLATAIERIEEELAALKAAQ